MADNMEKGCGLKTSMQKISEIKPYSLNAKNHPESQIKGLVESINRFGFTQPIVIDKNKTVIIGHGRLEAAKQCGLSMVPIIMRDDLKDQEVKALRLIDNRIAETGWDAELLHLNLKDFDFDFTPFNIDFDDIVVELKDFQSDVDPDDCPEVDEVEPRAKLGDVWILGDHRLMCGDSTKEADVVKLMDGEKADMVFTSPPYNGDTHLDYGNGQNKKLYENETDKWTSEEYVAFCHKSFKNIFKYTEGFIFWNVNYNAKSRFEYIKAIFPFIESLWETIVWKKTGMPISSGLTRDFEFVFCFKTGKRKHLSETFKTASNHWDVSNFGAQNKEKHRACFPVELPEKGIKIGSEEGQVVYDPFLGSGSTLIACQKTNRKCYGMEIDPKYCDVIIKRWEDYTGLTSELLKD